MKLIHNQFILQTKEWHQHFNAHGFQYVFIQKNQNPLFWIQRNVLSIIRLCIRVWIDEGSSKRFLFYQYLFIVNVTVGRCCRNMCAQCSVSTISKTFISNFNIHIDFSASSGENVIVYNFTRFNDKFNRMIMGIKINHCRFHEYKIQFTYSWTKIVHSISFIELRNSNIIWHEKYVGIVRENCSKFVDPMSIYGYAFINNVIVRNW